MTQLTIDTSHDLPLLQDRVLELRERLNGDMSPLMRAIGAVLENSTRQRFADKKAPNGVSWSELMPNTVRQKTNTRGNRDEGILVESGNLMQSITHHADKYQVSVGTPESYGVYHQFGTDKMVARPFLGISEQDESDIYEMINDYLTSI